MNEKTAAYAMPGRDAHNWLRQRWESPKRFSASQGSQRRWRNAGPWQWHCRICEFSRMPLPPMCCKKNVLWKHTIKRREEKSFLTCCGVPCARKESCVEAVLVRLFNYLRKRLCAQAALGGLCKQSAHYIYNGNHVPKHLSIDCSTTQNTHVQTNLITN